MVPNDARIQNTRVLWIQIKLYGTVYCVFSKFRYDSSVALVEMLGGKQCGRHVRKPNVGCAGRVLIQLRYRKWRINLESATVVRGQERRHHVPVARMGCPLFVCGSYEGRSARSIRLGRACQK